ncbi:glycosyltransferase family 4 protein [Cupriavidus cauae]|uniref:glycosyltransferase family 4 protein n=1 Tax=Cupriavidus cauae TaxID=2608999 RepID=UPI001CC20D3F|nr:glycosyltransferase family 4 protein [Cupriavidus cauae]
MPASASAADLGQAERPRIAYLITNSEIGGAQAHVATLLEALGERVEAIVLAGGDGPLLPAAEALGARTVRLSRLDNALSPLRAIAALRELMKALRQADPDLIHAHSAKAGALGRIAGWLLGIPVVYTVHGFGFKPAAPRRQRLAARVAEWLLAPLTARLICVSEAERELARSLPLPARRIAVIHNGIGDVPERAEPGAPMHRIVMVARFAAPKRPDLLIRAFAKLAEMAEPAERAEPGDGALARCELVIAGDGPQLPAMRALAQRLAPGRVVFTGNVAAVPALLASAQAFVLASDHEGFPLSILEAMRAGLPVVASDLPGIREQLDEGRCGLLCAPGSVPALADALARLAGDATLRTSLGTAARERWALQYGVTAMADATWAIYREQLPATAPANGPLARDRA